MKLPGVPRRSNDTRIVSRRKARHTLYKVAGTDISNKVRLQVVARKVLSVLANSYLKLPSTSVYVRDILLYILLGPNSPVVARIIPSSLPAVFHL